MLNETFVFKGKRAKSLGIELQSSVVVSQAVPRVTAVSIPGRNGDLHEYDGSYANRTITAECYILGYGLERKINTVNAWLMGEHGYFKLICSNDEKHFYMARATGGVDMQPAGELINAFTLTFDAMPQKFLVSGEKEFNMLGASSIYNPTAFTALPIIILEGTGDITVTIGDTRLTVLGLDGKLTYDAQLQTAYNGTENLNSLVTLESAPSIVTGKNELTVSGELTAFKIIPRWWEI